jgi:hypothetical protein
MTLDRAGATDRCHVNRRYCRYDFGGRAAFGGEGLVLRFQADGRRPPFVALQEFAQFIVNRDERLPALWTRLKSGETSDAGRTLVRTNQAATGVRSSGPRGCRCRSQSR